MDYLQRAAIMGAVGVLLTLAILFIGPFVTLLAINTIAGTSIEMTLGVYCAIFWLHLVVTKD